MSITNAITGAESEILGRLADGLDTQKADDFLDQLFGLAGRLGSINCSLRGDATLRLESCGAVLQDAEIPRAKTKIRMVCARLAVRCGEWSKQSVAPYGDVVEIAYTPTNQRFKIRFENTTSAQEIAIEIESGNGAPKSA
jgi:hypothetical protein